jgi:hypothetical protein
MRYKNNKRGFLMAKPISPNELPAPVVIDSKIEVINALHDLERLDLELLTESAAAGEAERASCTENDPPGAGGYFSYARTTRRLLEILIPRGWKRRMDRNFPLIVSPSRKIAITVSTGDDGTGVRGRPVKTKYAKGAATQDAIKNNQQLALIGFEREDQSIEQDLPKWVTWLLLRRRCRNTLYWELSLPMYMEEDQPISRWTRRIILPPISFDPDPGVGVHDDDVADDDIVIAVEPRR